MEVPGDFILDWN